MTISCGLPVSLSGINVSKQVLSVKRPDSYCVQSRETSRTAEIIFRKDCSSTCITLSGSSSSPSIFKDSVSPIKVLVTASKDQSVEKRPVSTMRKRRQSLIKEMAELDDRREILKQQRVNKECRECRADYFQAQALYALQQHQSAPDVMQALLNRLPFCLEDRSDCLYHSMAAAAA